MTPSQELRAAAARLREVGQTGLIVERLVWPQMLCHRMADGLEAEASRGDLVAAPKGSTRASLLGMAEMINNRAEIREQTNAPSG